MISVKTTSASARAFIAEHKGNSRPVVVVPTMGALHKGHLALVKRAHTFGQEPLVIMSIFVNPTQFGPDEDFDRYPRQLDDDVEILEGLKNAAPAMVFAPSVDDIYPKGSSTQVVPGPMATHLCAKQRRDHFNGVCTVVMRLLRILQADAAVFGEKDFQQLAIIRRMVKDLWLDVHIIGEPIVREDNNIALSSRNRYLSDPERLRAQSLSQALMRIRDRAAEGVNTVADLLSSGHEVLKRANIEPEYLEIVVAETLETVHILEQAENYRALVAARLGDTRLIDNMPLNTVAIPLTKQTPTP